jgi:hypothetical protein
VHVPEQPKKREADDDAFARALDDGRGAKGHLSRFRHERQLRSERCVAEIAAGQRRELTLDGGFCGVAVKEKQCADDYADKSGTTAPAAIPTEARAAAAL